MPSRLLNTFINTKQQGLDPMLPEHNIVLFWPLMGHDMNYRFRGWQRPAPKFNLTNHDYEDKACTLGGQFAG